MKNLIFPILFLFTLTFFQARAQETATSEQISEDLSMFGYSLNREGKNLFAKEIFNRSLGLNINNCNAWEGLAYTYSYFEDFETAMTVATEAYNCQLKKKAPIKKDIARVEEVIKSLGVLLTYQKRTAPK